MILDSLGLLSEGSLEDLWFGIGQGEIGGDKLSATGEGRETHSHSSAEGKPCPGSQVLCHLSPAGLALCKQDPGLAQHGEAGSRG